MELFNLEVSNSKFFNYIFPSVEFITYSQKRDYETNNLKWKSGVIYGDIGSGKSETYRSMVEKGVEKYKEENTHATISPSADLGMLVIKTSPNLINILMADDITKKSYNDEQITLYLRVRHYIKKVHEINEGYILGVLGTHRFHGVATELRTNTSFLVVRSLPQKGYDRNYIKRLITPQGIEDLKKIERNKLEDPSYFEYSVYWLKTDEVGILHLPLADKNYVRKI